MIFLVHKLARKTFNLIGTGKQRRKDRTMWHSLRKLADAAATIGGIIFAWNVAVEFAEQKVRAELKNKKHSSEEKPRKKKVADSDVTVERDGDTIKIHINK